MYLDTWSHIGSGIAVLHHDVLDVVGVSEYCPMRPATLKARRLAWAKKQKDALLEPKKNTHTYTKLGIDSRQAAGRPWAGKRGVESRQACKQAGKGVESRQQQR